MRLADRALFLRPHSLSVEEDYPVIAPHHVSFSHHCRQWRGSTSDLLHMKAGAARCRMRQEGLHPCQ